VPRSNEVGKRPVLVVTPNLCFDRTLWTDRLEPGTVSRPFRAAVTAGGKGVNVVRTLRDLGRPALLVGLLPREQGAELERLLVEEGTQLRPVPVRGSVRGATIILEADGRATVLNEPGPQVGEVECQALLAGVAEELARLSDGPGRAVVVCAGSLPPGLPRDTYGRVTRLVHEHGGRVVVDAAREVLAATLPSGPDVVTPNLAEAEGVLRGAGTEPFGHAADVQATSAAARVAAASLRRLGASAAVVTAGEHGVAWADAEGTHWQPALEVRPVNPIGAGDSFVGGLVSAMLDQSPAAADAAADPGANQGAGRDRDAASGWPAAVRYATAVAGAAVEQPTAGRVDADRVAELTRLQAARL
jgi:1-phosphofructokinase family hexose kinase